jgi:hypothetical protein
LLSIHADALVFCTVNGRLPPAGLRLAARSLSGAVCHPWYRGQMHDDRLIGKHRPVEGRGGPRRRSSWCWGSRRAWNQRGSLKTPARDRGGLSGRRSIWCRRRCGVRRRCIGNRGAGAGCTGGSGGATCGTGLSQPASTSATRRPGGRAHVPSSLLVRITSIDRDRQVVVAGDAPYAGAALAQLRRNVCGASGDVASPVCGAAADPPAAR